jgi:hypothetical protein
MVVDGLIELGWGIGLVVVVEGPVWMVVSSSSLRGRRGRPTFFFISAPRFLIWYLRE